MKKLNGALLMLIAMVLWIAAVALVVAIHFIVKFW